MGKCIFNSITCSLNQKWNNDQCQCRFISKKRHSWNKETEGAVFSKEIKDFTNYMGSCTTWTQDMLASLHELDDIDMQSSCGTFEYENVTSAVTESVLLGSGGRFTMKFRKCFVSLMCDGRLLARG